jgi:hypothetical protein
MSFIHPLHGEKQLKYACEECHTRKIRCYALPDTQPGCCTPCHQNGRKCLFALRSKTGRPKRTAQQKAKETPPTMIRGDWEPSPMTWERPHHAMRHHSENSIYAFRGESSSVAYEDHKLPPLSTPNSFSPLLNAAQPASPRMLDFEMDCIPASELPGMFQLGQVGSYSNTSSGTSSDVVSSECFGVPLNSSLSEPVPTVSFARPPALSTSKSDHSSVDASNDTTYGQAMYLSQQIHQQCALVRSRHVEFSNRGSATEVSQILDTFDSLARLLKQQISSTRSSNQICCLMIGMTSAALYVAVLQAVFMAKSLLNGELQSSFQQSRDDHSALFVHNVEEESLPSSVNSPDSVGSLDGILNLTKLEYYLTIYNQFLQLYSTGNRGDLNTNSGSERRRPSLKPLMDHEACIDTTEALQGQVRALLSQSRQAVH